MALGLPNSLVNRMVAQQEASQIGLDIASGNFDPSLKKYKPPRGGEKSSDAQVAGLFRKFMAAQVTANCLRWTKNDRATKTRNGQHFTVAAVGAQADDERSRSVVEKVDSADSLS